MRIYMVTLGSRGDNEPFRALAKEASTRGHDVVFAHTEDLPVEEDAPYQEWGLPGSFSELIANRGISVLRALRDYRSMWKPLIDGVLSASTRQIREFQPDVVVYHPKVLTAVTAAHQVGALAVVAEMFPTLTPTREFPAAGITATLPESFNRASYSLVSWGISAFGNPAKKLAEELRVSSWSPDLSLCPVSPSLVPQPADWPPTSQITGHWFQQRRDNPDIELADFLSAGNVAYAGFGSMRKGDARKRAEVVVNAARANGLRTLLVTGWGGLDGADFSDATDVIVRQSVTHESVLPLVDVAIHHGGAGTVHAMLRAGVPSVIMPFVADQPWWAKRLYEAGLGPRPLSASTRNVHKVSAAITSALKATPHTREVSRQMSQENGVASALNTIEISC